MHDCESPKCWCAQGFSTKADLAIEVDLQERAVILRALRVLAAVEDAGKFDHLHPWIARIESEGHLATAGGDRESAHEADRWWEISTWLRDLSKLSTPED